MRDILLALSGILIIKVSNRIAYRAGRRDQLEQGIPLHGEGFSGYVTEVRLQNVRKDGA